jgi:hypothetical protein
MSTDVIDDRITTLALRQTLLAGFAVQFLVLLLSALVMDRGVVFLASSHAAVGYWVGVILILLFRHKNPLPSDFWYHPVGILGAGVRRPVRRPLVLELPRRHLGKGVG